MSETKVAFTPSASPKAGGDTESGLTTHPAETGHFHSRRANLVPRRRLRELARVLCLLATGPLIVWAAFETGGLAVNGMRALSERFFDRASPAPPRGSVLAHAEVGDVVWGPCDGPETVPGAECGYAIVPLDYFDASAGKAKIALGRYNATSGTRKGSIFLNPGGPGGSGVDLATSGGPNFQSLIGEDYDIVGFDPRGIGKTEPATLCFPEPGSRTAFIANTVIDRGYDSSANISDANNRYHLVETQRDANALYKTQFAICSQTMGETIKYMGTSTVARDIDYLTTLLDGEDALINFYGFSYGSAMGQYFLNMFPDRVGRVAIDGMVDADVWSNTPPYQWFVDDWLSSTEGVYDRFFKDCAQAGPSGCALAKAENEDPSDIKARVESFIEDIFNSPLPVPNATAPGILTIGRARYYQLDTFTSPRYWPDVASAFAAAMAGNGTAILNAVNEKGLVDLELSAVTCNDARPFSGPTPETFIDAQLAAMAITRFALAVITHEPDSGCEFWPVTPPERFLGPWNATLSNPILIISNTLDPLTSLANGKNVLSRMGKNAGLLIQDGPGHCSTAMSSTCTTQHRRAFFADGTLPPEGTVCAIDSSSFPDAAKVAAMDAEALKVQESVRAVAELLARKRTRA